MKLPPCGSQVAGPSLAETATETTFRSETEAQGKHDRLPWPPRTSDFVCVNVVNKKNRETLLFEIFVLQRGSSPSQFINAFNASSLTGYPRIPTALKATSTRVHITAMVNGHPVNEFTIDTATHVPCIYIRPTHAEKCKHQKTR